ncbi:unnamed protein product [Rhodiola kirilowii]
MSQGVPNSSNLGFFEDQNYQNSDSGNIMEAQSAAASSSGLKRKRNLPGTPDPDSEVVALSPNSLMATNKFLCEVCKKGFQRDQNLQLHRRGHNLPWKLKQRSKQEVVKKKVYICPEKSCVHHDPSRALGDLTGIKKHFYRKHGEKKWKCDKCSKKYAVKSDWKAHSKICGTKEHKCDCGTLFSRKDSFITHRAFCTAVVDQSSSRFASSSSCAGFNKNLSLRNDYLLSGTLGNLQSTIESNQFSGGGFYPELSSSSFQPYGHVNNNVDGSKPIRPNNTQWLDQHPLNPSAHFLMGNSTVNLSHDQLQLLQNAGHTNLFGSSSSSSQAQWMDKCTDHHHSAFGNANMSPLDQIIENASTGGVMQVKREDNENLSNDQDFVANMTSLYNPSNSNHHHQMQQAVTRNQSTDHDQFLSNFFARNNNNHSQLGFMNNGFTHENGFTNSSSFTRPPHVITKDWDHNKTENVNVNDHLMLLHEAAAGLRGGGGEKENKQDIIKKQDVVVESSQTRDFLGVGGNEMSREEFQLADDDDLDMSHYNQQWKQYN